MMDGPGSSRDYNLRNRPVVMPARLRDEVPALNSPLTQRTIPFTKSKTPSRAGSSVHSRSVVGSYSSETLAEEVESELNGELLELEQQESTLKEAMSLIENEIQSHTEDVAEVQQRLTDGEGQLSPDEVQDFKQELKKAQLALKESLRKKRSQEIIQNSRLEFISKTRAHLQERATLKKKMIVESNEQLLSSDEEDDTSQLNNQQQEEAMRLQTFITDSQKERMEREAQDMQRAVEQELIEARQRGEEEKRRIQIDSDRRMAEAMQAQLKLEEEIKGRNSSSVVSVPDENIKLPMKPSESSQVSAIEMLAKAIQSIIPQQVEHEGKSSKFLARQSYAKELPFFSGKPEELPIFKADFERSTTDCGFSHSENMSRLRRCLKGDAAEYVQCMMVSPDNVPQIMKDLEERYGQPENIISAMILKARELPPFTQDDLESLIRFGSAVKNLSTTVLTLKRPEHLCNPELLQELERKLPPSVVMQWYRWLQDDSNRKNNLEYFSKWIAGEVTLACKVRPSPVVVEKAAKREEHSQNKNKKPKYEKTPEWRMESDVPSVAGLYAGEKNFSKCIFCSKHPDSMNCSRALDMTSAEKKKIISDVKCCHNCLGIGHFVRDCKVFGKCFLCKKRHPTLMCPDLPSNKEEKETSKDKEAPQKVNALFAGSGNLILSTVNVTILRDRHLKVCNIFKKKLNVPTGETTIETEEGEMLEDDEMDVPLDCNMITRTMDKYWACLVDGPVNFVKQAANEKETIPDNWGYHVYKRIKTKTKSAPRKRRADTVTSSSQGPYIPLDPNFIIRIVPVAEYDNDRVSARDQFYNASPYLYKHLGTNNLDQQNPPWSYHGDFGPKEWHTLELEKFLVPFKKNLTAQEAMSTNFYYELKWRTDQHFRNLWERIIRIIYDDLFQYQSSRTPAGFYPLFTLNSSYWNTPDAFSVQTPADPNGGYYSSMRFNLPAPLRKADLDTLNASGILTPGFEFPPASFPPDIKYVRNVLLEIEKAKNEGKSLRPEFEAFYQVFIPLAEKHIKDIGYTTTTPDPTDPSATPLSTVGMIVDVINRVVDDELALLQVQDQVSLPVMPRRFPICEGKEPSPIDIIPANSIRSSLRPYEFGENFYKMYRIHMLFEPDGTNLLEVKFANSERLGGNSISLDGGAVKGTDLHFEIMQIKFGTDKNSGTEHRINGVSYGMELQFIFSNKGPDQAYPYYHTLARTVNDLFAYREKLVIIISVLVEVVPRAQVKNPFLFEALTQVAYKFREQREKYPDGLYNETYREFETLDYVMSLSDFIPTDSLFYTYRGGLNFPPCFSNVVWSVYEGRLQITDEQYTEFLLIPSVGRDDTDHVAGNIRRIEDEWVREEHVPGILPADQENLRRNRQNRALLRSLDQSNTGTEQVYDYYYNYD